MAEAAARCSGGHREAAGGAIPGGLADVGAGRGARGERGAADGQRERVGGRKADLQDRRAPIRAADRAVVAGAGGHRDVVRGRPPQDGVHLGHLSPAEEVLPQAPADRRHVGAGDGEPQRGDHVRGRGRGAVQDVGGQQDHAEGGGGGDRVHHLEVLDLLGEPCQGEAEPARVVTTWIRAAGRGLSRPGACLGQVSGRPVICPRRLHLDGRPAPCRCRGERRHPGQQHGHVAGSKRPGFVRK